jgi:hypothetical protein
MHCSKQGAENAAKEEVKDAAKQLTVKALKKHLISTVLYPLQS